MTTGTFTILVPVFNEATTIPEIVRRVDAVRSSLLGKVLLLFVDDGSTDDSSSVLRGVSTESWVSYTRIEKRVGQHHALLTGFRVALETSDSELIGTMDADMDPGPEAFLLMLPHSHIHDLLIGRRIERHRSLFRWAISGALWLFSQCIRPNRISDHGSMFRVYRSDLAARILQYSHHGAFIAGLSLLCTRHADEIPVKSIKPVERSSRYSFSRIVKTGWQMIRLILHHPCGIGVNRHDISGSGHSTIFT